MKKLFLLVVCSFFTHTTFAQSERDQKIQKVQEKQSQRTNVNNNNTNYNQGYQNGYDNGVRNNRYSTPYYYNPYDVGYYPRATNSQTSLSQSSIPSYPAFPTNFILSIKVCGLMVLVFRQ